MFDGFVCRGDNVQVLGTVRGPQEEPCRKGGTLPVQGGKL